MADSVQLIKDRLAKLPPYIREALNRISWDKSILEIGKKYGLHVDQMGALQTETILVLVGLAHPDQYANNLRKELNIPAEKLSGIVAEANEKIFKTIRQALIDFLTREEMDKKGYEGKIPMSIFEKTGIDIEPEKPKIESDILIGSIVPEEEKEVLEHAGVKIDEDRTDIENADNASRNELLTEIEHPSKSHGGSFSSLVRTNLSDTVISAPGKSKYEEPKPSVTEPAKKSDPYREPIAE